MKIFRGTVATFAVPFIVFGTKDRSVLKFTISFVDGRYRVTDAILYGVEFCLQYMPR